ncbi:MAG: ATP-binding protein [Saprospiraceae bacterium]|nr:ATP-binding protein [Saprospiraceae bacterium]
MQTIIIGRKPELKILENALSSNEAELIAVTGRRRVGKTFLIAEAYKNHIVFELIGTQNGLLETQLESFADQLSDFSKTDFAIKPPATWSEAFRLLRGYIQKSNFDSKKVLFFDELPWLAGQKSGFLEAFGYFWNSWASRQNLVIAICGSAASWMIQKVVNDTGGLHNRITRHIHLLPFTLYETEQYLQSRNTFYDRYQIVQLYMALGGIPHYLKKIDPTKSVIQNIDTLCFSDNGALIDEFNRLYPSLFPNSDNHILVIRTLAQKRQGMTRNELIEHSKLSNGGGLTTLINELLQSGFISEIYPFGKAQKDKLYRLSDEYSLFYLQFIEKNRQQGRNLWHHLSQTPTYKSWSGFAFESVCMKHSDQIRQALSIAGIFSTVSSFYQKGTDQEEGVQIDMVLDRNDHTINLFEIKFYNQPFTLTKTYADQLRQKMWRFQNITKTKKQVNWLFITTFGLISNQYSSGLVSNTLSLDDLFL